MLVLYINLQKLTKTVPMINPMGIGSPWVNAYLDLQQKEQSYVRFI